ALSPETPPPMTATRSWSDRLELNLKASRIARGTTGRGVRIKCDLEQAVTRRTVVKPERPSVLCALARPRPLRNRSEAMFAPAPSADEMKRWLKAVAEEQDREAFGRLFQFFAPRIASLIERSGLSAAEAEEISQETMVIVWRKAALYDSSQAGVSTWIFTIARNLRVDQARKASRANAGVAALRVLPLRLEASVEETALASERDARV